ncbi:MAG: YbjQ family protein [Alphaproteobacteria bacterium]|nr:YbjQ family protein [Alphaproteobacteria bacterium]
MLLSTTDSIEGREIVEYLGIVSGETVYGANFVHDFFASIRDVVGGRAGGYEKVLRAGKTAALDDMVEQARELRADAIIGIDIDYETVGERMLMVSANGTAVRLR